MSQAHCTGVRFVHFYQPPGPGQCDISVFRAQGEAAVQLGSYAGEKPEGVIVDCKMFGKLCSTFSVPDHRRPN